MATSFSGCLEVYSRTEERILSATCLTCSMGGSRKGSYSSSSW
jgi:hypothetical protein